MKRIIVPTGYMGSGSSAITDLIAEFNDCQNEFKSYEYILLHCPTGLFDLEDKLLLGNNALRSDEAIRAFEHQMKKLYDKKFWWVGNYQNIIGHNFMSITNDFIDKITEFKYDGYWYTHEEVNFKMFMKLLLLKPFKVIFRNYKFPKVLKYKDGMKISFINKDNFYKYAQDYIYEIIKSISKNKDNVILDQFLLPFNLYRADNYFDEKLKVIVVERDPRDVFILNKYTWKAKKNNEIPIPTEVNLFCNYYDKMRQSEIKTDSSKVLRIKFEDLIYNYDKTLKIIMNFLNFTDKDHINKKNRFNPDISILNTQLFNKEIYKEEVKIIEKKLLKYLYKFSYQLNNDIEKTVEFE